MELVYKTIPPPLITLFGLLMSNRFTLMSACNDIFDVADGTCAIRSVDGETEAVPALRSIDTVLNSWLGIILDRPSGALSISHC